MFYRLNIILWNAILLVLYWLFYVGTTNFDKRFAKKIRKTFERLGPVYVKLGQMLSMRPDFINQVYCHEFEQLLDCACPIKRSVVAKIISMELKKPFEREFSFINAEPLASGSLSQVHRATLTSGEDVVVKILRPRILKVIKTDTRIMIVLAKIVGAFIGNVGKKYWVELVENVEGWLKKEVDLLQELKNMETIRKELKGLTGIRIPKTYPRLSTKGILVMEYMNGYLMSELIRHTREGTLPEISFSPGKKVVELIEKIGVTSFQRGHFHADLHPGNIIITEDGEIALLDFGLIQYFDPNLRQGILLFMIGATMCNPEIIIRAAKSVAEIEDCFDERKVYAQLSFICERFKNASGNEMSLGQFMVVVINLCLRYGVKFPWPLILYVRSAFNVDGMALKLCPDFKFAKHTKGLFVKIYFQNVLAEKLSLGAVINFVDTFLSKFNKTAEEYETVM